VIRRSFSACDLFQARRDAAIGAGLKKPMIFFEPPE
jgi:hypothetical protein